MLHGGEDMTLVKFILMAINGYYWLFLGYCHQKALNYGGFFTIARLGYNNLMGVFYLLLVGIGLSILVLIGENILFAINTRKQRNSKSSTQPTMVIDSADSVKVFGQ